MRSFLTKAALALPLAAAGAYFRELLPALIALAAVMASDYVTGMLSAWASRTLSSRIGLRGLVKKLGYIFGVGVAVTVDFIVQTAGERLGADFSGFYLFGLLVTVWLIGNECISILENLSELGVPVPPFLKAAAARLKTTAERAAPAEAPSAEPHLPPLTGEVARSAGRVSPVNESAQTGETQETGETPQSAPWADSLRPALPQMPFPGRLRSRPDNGAAAEIASRLDLPQAAAGRNSPVRGADDTGEVT